MIERESQHRPDGVQPALPRGPNGAWRGWINVDAIRRVRSLLDSNLLDAVEGKLLERLVTEPAQAHSLVPDAKRIVRC